MSFELDLDVRQHTMVSQKDHMRMKEMYTGYQTQVEKHIYTVDDYSSNERIEKPKFVRSKLSYTPACYKIIDEIIVNASDHCTNNPDKVTYIKIDFDVQNGIIAIQNDGPGIPVYPVEIKFDINGEPTDRHLKLPTDKPSDAPGTVTKWLPQFLSEQPNTGNNLHKRKIHITGGVNGAGMKLTNYYSEFFIIETIDGNRKLYFRQLMENGARKINPPEIKPIGDMKPFTKICFKPNYKGLDYPNAGPRDYAVLEQIVKTRAYQIASYTNVQVIYQGKVIPIKTIADLGEMFAPQLQKININPLPEDEDEKDENNLFKNLNIGEIDLSGLDKVSGPKFGKKDKKDKSEKNIVVEKRTYVYSTQLKSADQLDERGNSLTWNVCVGPSMSEKFEQMSVVNGMYIIDGGTHVDFIVDQVVSFFAKEIAKVTDLLEATEARIRNNIYVVMVGPINKPSIDSQTKERIGNKPKQYEGYRFSPKQLKDIWNMCEQFILSAILINGSGKKKGKKPSLNKYRPAKYSKIRARAQQCTLFVPEGDSAANLVDGALTDKSLPKFTYDYYGYYNILGVPMNARKFSKLITNPKTGQKTMLYSDAIRDNERLNGLYYVLGLDETKDYRSEADMKTLNYGSLVLATDQDEDGKGNITSLILNYFMVFWPALIERGYVKRLNTPIIRSTHKTTNKVFGFNSVNAFKRWQAELKISEDDFAKQYESHYYKGLARHDEDDIRDIFNHFDHNLHVYCLDEKSQELFEEYFGKSSDSRKEHLRTPVNLDFAENAKYISVSHHLQIDTKSFKRYKICCMLPHAYDGFLNTRRKIFTTARRIMNKSQTMNVSALAGRVRSDMHHHHGDAAITDSITKMGQEFFPRLIPVFLGNSIAKGFGSRKFGGNNAGQPRYLEIKQNIKVTDLLFPEEDDWLLPYVFEEGERSEPVYYLPIIPMALLESQHHPAHGWDIRCWSRDWKIIFQNIRTAIQSYQIVQAHEGDQYDQTNPYIKGLKIIQNMSPELASALKSNNQSIPNNLPDGSLMAPLAFMKMDTTNWKGKLTSVSIPSKDNKPPKIKNYSVGTYVYDQKTNTICITELPHGITSDNYVYGNREAIEKRKKKFKEKEALDKLKAQKLWDIEHAAHVEEKKTRGKKTTLVSAKTVNQLSKVNGKNSVFDENHGEELSNDLMDLMLDDDAFDINFDAIDNDKFMWKARQFVTTTIVDKDLVADVDDRSTDKDIEIYIELKPDAMNKIDEYKNEIFDGVIEYFKLRVVIHDSLNFIDGDSEYIREFKNYDEIFRSWFVARKKMYEQRFIRTLIIYELQILKLQLIQRFCDDTRRDTTQNEPKFTLARKSKENQEKILEQFGYPKIGTEIISNPKYIPVNMIRYEALENKENLNYRYVLQLTQSQTSDDAYVDRNEEIRKLQALMQKLISEQKYFPGAVWWLEELNALEPVVARGLNEGWGYDQRKKKYNH